MIDEIELFYKIVEAAVREDHAEYLKEQKRVPVVRDLPVVDELPTGDEWRGLGLFARIQLKKRYNRQVRARRVAERRRDENMADRLLKGFNAGIERALRVLSVEYDRFEKRRKKAEEREGTL